MPIKYRVVNWIFDCERFGRHIKAWGETVGYGTVGDVLGVTDTTIKNWAKGEFAGEFPHPRMGNFLKACNELSLQPMDFFRLED